MKLISPDGTLLRNDINSSWEGRICIKRLGNPCEVEVSSRGTWFHMIFGSHEYGNFLCVLNHGIGTEISDLRDVFWNFENLSRHYPDLSEPDLCSIVESLRILAEYAAI